jgi:hypothetical protein
MWAIGKMRPIFSTSRPTLLMKNDLGKMKNDFCYKLWAIGKMRPIISTSWPTLKTNEK